jgi:hypothetical protein
MYGGVIGGGDPMEMATVLASFRDLCDDPVAWAILAAVSAKALFSLYVFNRCPVVNRIGLRDVQALEKYREDRVSPRFLFIMLGGIALAVGGLYALRSPDVGPLALAAIVLGVFVLLVEPSQLTIHDNTLRAAAARRRGGEAYDVALDRLRGAHLERMMIEFAFAGLLALVILAY